MRGLVKATVPAPASHAGDLGQRVAGRGDSGLLAKHLVELVFGLVESPLLEHGSCKVHTGGDVIGAVAEGLGEQDQGLVDPSP